MSGEYGVVINVATINAGAYFVADAAISATTLFLDDVSVFDELGGQCTVPTDIGANNYFYTAIDLALNTMTLQSGLLVAATADTSRVELWPPAPVRTAFVQFGIEESEAVRVTIPHSIGGMPDGVRLSNDQEIVLVEERAPGELFLKDVMARGMINLQPGDDLDNFTSEGNFVQTVTADALGSLNYPPQTATGAWAGFLEVLSTRASTLMMQRYTAYRSTAPVNQLPSIWCRTFALGAWSPWVAVQDDTYEISTVSQVAVAATNFSITSAHLRKIGKLVSIQIYLTYSGAGITVPASGDIANTSVCTMHASWHPNGGYTQGGLCAGNSGRSAMFSIDTDGLIQVTAVGGSGDILTGASLSVGGQYFLD